MPTSEQPSVTAEINYRVAKEADVPAIFAVRTSVTENALTIEELTERGVTNASVAASFTKDSKGWVAVYDSEIIGFSIADRKDSSLFGLFVLPIFEARGVGSELLKRALVWLSDNGSERVWLHTAPKTKAAAFYQRRGWVQTGTRPTGDVRFEFDLSATYRDSQGR
jgi:GNAT superfamily N-acetyltransferase